MKFAAKIGETNYAVIRHAVQPLGFMYYVFDEGMYEAKYKEITDGYANRLNQYAQAVVFVGYNYSDFNEIRFMKNRFRRSETKELLQEIL